MQGQTDVEMMQQTSAAPGIFAENGTHLFAQQAQRAQGYVFEIADRSRNDVEPAFVHDRILCRKVVAVK
jgi:hypothetical protein